MFLFSQSTIFMWKNRYCLNTQYNHVMMNLLHHFRHHKSSIYWLAMICLGIVSDNQYFFLNSLLGCYLIVINFFHSCMITVCQAKNAQTRKHLSWEVHTTFPTSYYHKYTSLFCQNIICRNIDKFCGQYSVLKKFPRLQVIVVSFMLKTPMSLLWNFWGFDLKME